MFYTTDPTTRAEFITGLHELASFLQAHPDVPVPQYGADITLHADAYEHGGKDQADRIARLLAAPITDETTLGGHYSATRDFGPLSYTIAAIPDAATARYQAEKTYWGCIEPDAEPEPDGYDDNDPGPECDDQGGMSEYRSYAAIQDTWSER